MTHHLVRLLEILLYNSTIPSDWKRSTVIPIYKGGDRSAVNLYSNNITFCGLQANGTLYSRVFEVSLGKE